MRQRALSSVIVVLLTLGPAFLGRYIFTVLIALVIGAALHEFNTMARFAGHRPASWAGYATIAALLLAVLFQRWGQWGGTIVTAAVALTLIGLMFRRDYHGMLTDWALTVAGMLYIGLLGAHFILLRDLTGSLDSLVARIDNMGAWQYRSGADTALGLGWYLLAQIVTWLTDVGAYLVGRSIGRNKLAPAISPGKTVEGGIGGLILGALASLGCAWAFGLPLHPLVALGVGAVLSAIGQAGDLAESLIKRQAGVKDSGSLIPGHGGVLDRIDSLLVVVTVTYYLAKVLT
jgi:phosphatidate cytidylyltransferase